MDEPVTSRRQPRPHHRWHHQLVRRFCYLWPVKAIGTSVFMTLFFWCYFAVLRSHPGTAVEVPRLWLDDWIGFSPAAFPVYASLWIYVSLPPALMASFRTLATFGVWVGTLCALCLGIFWFWPTSTPPTPMNWDLYPGLAMIKGVDAAGNACPSLHVGSSVFSAMWLRRQLSDIAAPRWLQIGNVLVCAAIAWSTIATLQHVTLDVIAGAAIGAAFGGMSLRHTQGWR